MRQRQNRRRTKRKLKIGSQARTSWRNTSVVCSILCWYLCFAQKADMQRAALKLLKQKNLIFRMHSYSSHGCANCKRTNIYLLLLKCSLETVSALGPSVCCYFPRQTGWLIGGFDLSRISSSGYKGLVPAETAWQVWECTEKKKLCIPCQRKHKHVFF